MQGSSLFTGVGLRLLGHCADFRSIGGIVTLFDLLDSTHATLRAGAAENLAAMVQNYPQAQQARAQPPCLPPTLLLLLLRLPTRSRACLMMQSCLHELEPCGFHQVQWEAAVLPSILAPALDPGCACSR